MNSRRKRRAWLLPVTIVLVILLLIEGFCYLLYDHNSPSYVQVANSAARRLEYVLTEHFKETGFPKAEPFILMGETTRAETIFYENDFISEEQFSPEYTLDLHYYWAVRISGQAITEVWCSQTPLTEADLTAVTFEQQYEQLHFYPLFLRPYDLEVIGYYVPRQTRGK